METTMQEVKKASVRTSLSLGLVEADVKLYKTTGKGEKDPTFTTAGPNGYPLRVEQRAQEAAVEETEKADPLGLEDGDDGTVVPAAAPAVEEDPGPEVVPPTSSVVVGSAPGTFKNVMVEEETGVEVEPDDVRRGVRRDDGTFVDLTGRLTAIDEETKLDRIQVLDFIRRERVPRERVVGSYYLAADSKSAPRVLRVLYEGMKRAERVAIVRWTKVKGQSLGLLVPHGSGALVVLECVFADAARKPNAACLAHMRAAVTEKQVDRAVELIESMNAPPSALDGYFDRRAQLQRQLAEKAEEGDDLADFAVVEEPSEALRSLDELLVASAR
jgi:non-homologous end joining protein Ku